MCKHPGKECEARGYAHKARSMLAQAGPAGFDLASVGNAMSIGSQWQHPHRPAVKLIANNFGNCCDDCIGGGDLADWPWQIFLADWSVHWSQTWSSETI